MRGQKKVKVKDSSSHCSLNHEPNVYRYQESRARRNNAHEQLPLTDTCPHPHAGVIPSPRDYKYPPTPDPLQLKNAHLSISVLRPINLIHGQGSPQSSVTVSVAGRQRQEEGGGDDGVAEIVTLQLQRIHRLRLRGESRVPRGQLLHQQQERDRPHGRQRRSSFHN